MAADAWAATSVRQALRAVPELTESVLTYLDHPQPIFSRIPLPYRVVPLGVRTRLLGAIGRLRARSEIAFPGWPIERSVDDAHARVASSYDGREAALLITHDIDTAAELRLIEPLRQIERRAGVPGAFGFVPKLSWPTEDLAQSLVGEGCEVYWHDIGHDGRLPYLGLDAIRAAFDRVLDQSPWAVPLMRAFRSGQLLMSRDLLEVVAERFAIDLSIPDTERDGPYGAAAGCATVFPFRIRGLLELPLTLPQDVYLRRVYDLSPDEVLHTWTDKFAYIKSVGGVAVLNVHPVWVNPRDPGMLAAFEKFVMAAAEDQEILVTTPTALGQILGNR